tara:strand:+ start:3884 stop:4078 length:195 start_codon:yes stop_codon:yes gene_type:complete
MSKIVNVKVSHIRPSYTDLHDWMKNPENEYIGRGGVVFITLNGDKTKKKNAFLQNLLHGQIHLL